MLFDFNKTLEELLNLSDFTHEDETINAVYHQRLLREYSNEDLVVMIEQSLGLHILIPFALDLLEENIFSEGDADLLSVVVAINSFYWQTHPNEISRLKILIEKNLNTLKEAYKKITI